MQLLRREGDNHLEEMSLDGEGRSSGSEVSGILSNIHKFVTDMYHNFSLFFDQISGLFGHFSGKSTQLKLAVFELFWDFA